VVAGKSSLVNLAHVSQGEARPRAGLLLSADKEHNNRELTEERRSRESLSTTLSLLRGSEEPQLAVPLIAPAAATAAI
jgi:hypothetical protein